MLPEWTMELLESVIIVIVMSLGIELPYEMNYKKTIHMHIKKKSVSGRGLRRGYNFLYFKCRYLN